MKVDPVRTPAATAAKRSAGGVEAGFALPAQDGPQAAQSVRPAAPVAALDAILALQVDEGPRTRRLRRAHAALDSLDAVKRALLGLGGLEDARAALLGLGEAREPTGDPDLDEVLNEIEVRRAVELAKLEVG